MKKLNNVIALALIGIVAGVVLGEFFPKLLTSGVMGSIGNAISEPFSGYRNDMAVKYGLFGGGIGAALGLVLMFISIK